ncbi:PAS domain-containing sensor histidine kinase [Vibrio ziniensis]|uniref:histidine kinase n=1 Tax=Vibrio ziniensis TaxID=2711221 RepID=A0A6G7CN19_9VIBR|nr:ATP-binding protein [Vibrio ziniensis]QIH43531.1 ATP-binding protein [Vibrio ziniensis]
MNKSRQFIESDTNPFYSRIGRRIIIILVLLSGAVTLVATLTQTYFNYKSEFSDVEQRHQEIEIIHSELLSASLWDYDLVLLQQRLDSLVELPKLSYLKIVSGKYKFEAGTPVTESSVTSTYPLYHVNPDDNKMQQLGTIYIESSAQEIYNTLIKQFIITLLVNAAKTIFVCAVILMVFHQSVNRRIFSVAQYLRKYNPRHPADKLCLEHKKWIMEKDDELNWLAEETNTITSNVTTLYRNIKFEQERFADFTQVSSDWLWETNMEGHLTYVSEPMREMLEIDEFTRPTFAQIPWFVDVTELLRALETKQNFAKCEQQLKIDGYNIYMMFQGIARYENNRFVGYRGTTINITQLKSTQLELQTLNYNLEKKIDERTRDLKQSMEHLQKTQEQLIESEKLAALGGLVAGVAHEVNTPLGIAVTATSVIQEVKSELNSAFALQTLTSTQFSELMQRLADSSALLESNLNRAAKLVRDFKQTAVDQVSEQRSQFRIHQVIEALIASLHSETRKIPVEPKIQGDEQLMMTSLPGVLTQILTNLIMNSVNHAFKETQQPSIAIHFYEQGDDIVLEYKDNGCGVEEALHQKIFEPFFTTKRGVGGSGLGLNLVFNLLKKKLNGELLFESEVGHGVHYTITMPKVLAPEMEH